MPPCRLSDSDLLETQGLAMDGLVIDFPRSPSPNIEWESEEENEEPEEKETREQLREAEVGRLLGSSWIADLTHMGEEVDGGSQCSASIGSWEGEAKVQPFGEKSDTVENVYEEEGTKREVEGIGRSRRRKKALKGGLEEQLERALEWGR